MSKKEIETMYCPKCKEQVEFEGETRTDYLTSSSLKRFSNHKKGCKRCGKVLEEM